MPFDLRSFVNNVLYLGNRLYLLYKKLNHTQLNSIYSLLSIYYIDWFKIKISSNVIIPLFEICILNQICFR